MLSWIKSKIIFIVLVLSLLANVGLFALVVGKGIHISNSSTAISNSTSNSIAYSGSMSIGYIGGDYRGKWTIEIKEFSTLQLMYEFIETLDPIQFLNCKIIEQRVHSGQNTYKLYYPIITEKVREKKGETQISRKDSQDR